MTKDEDFMDVDYFVWLNENNDVVHEEARNYFHAEYGDKWTTWTWKNSVLRIPTDRIISIITEREPTH